MVWFSIQFDIIFTENEIDESALSNLPQNIISNLIVKAGPLVKFQVSLEKYKIKKGQ